MDRFLNDTSELQRVTGDQGDLPPIRLYVKRSKGHVMPDTQGLVAEIGSGFLHRWLREAT